MVVARYRREPYEKDSGAASSLESTPGSAPHTDSPSSPSSDSQESSSGASTPPIIVRTDRLNQGKSPSYCGGPMDYKPGVKYCEKHTAWVDGHRNSGNIDEEFGGYEDLVKGVISSMDANARKYSVEIAKHLEIVKTGVKQKGFLFPALSRESFLVITAIIANSDSFKELKEKLTNSSRLNIGYHQYQINSFLTYLEKQKFEKTIDGADQLPPPIAKKISECKFESLKIAARSLHDKLNISSKNRLIDSSDITEFADSEVKKYQASILFNLDVAKKQIYAARQEGGYVMNIAMHEPALEEFQSQFNPDFTIPSEAHKHLISRGQLQALKDIDRAFSRGVKNDGMVGKAEIRLATGRGKTHLSKLIKKFYGDRVYEISTVNLNSFGEKIDELIAYANGSEKPLSEPGKVNYVSIDESFFFAKYFREKFTNPELARKDQKDFTDDDYLEIETQRFSFLRNLRKNGIIAITLGASEVLSKVEIEELRNEDKLLALESQIEESKRLLRIESSRQGDKDMKKALKSFCENFISTEISPKPDPIDLYMHDISKPVYDYIKNIDEDSFALLGGKFHDFAYEVFHSREILRFSIKPSEFAGYIYGLLISDKYKSLLDSKGPKVNVAKLKVNIDELEQEKERRQGRLNAKKDYRQDLEDRQNDVYRKINSSATGIVDPLEGGDAIDQIVTVVPEGQGGFMQYVTDDNLDGLRGAEGQMTRLLEQGKFDAVVTGFVGEDGVLRHRIFEKGSVKTVETAEELNEEAARLKGGRVLSVFANGSDYIGGDNEGFSFNVTFRALKLSKAATVNDYMQGMSRKRDLVFADDDQGDDAKTDMVIISDDDKDSLTQRVKVNSEQEDLKKTLAYIMSKSQDGSWYHAFTPEERDGTSCVYDHLLRIARDQGVDAAIEAWRVAIDRDRALVYANRDQDIDAQSGQNDALGRGGKGRQGGSSRSATPQREGVGDSGSENLLSSDGSSKTSSRRSSTSDSAGPSSSSARSSRQVSVQTDRVISADSQSQSAPSRSSDAETSTTIASSSDITTQTSNSNSTSVHSQTTPVPSSGHGDHAPGRDAEPTRSGLQGSRSTSESFSDTSSEGARDAEGLRSEIDDLKDRLNRLMESFEDAVARFATFADHPNSSFLSDPSSHRAQADSSDRVDHHADHQREVGKGRFAQAAQAAQDFQKNLIEQFANERAVVARYQEALIQAHAREIEEARRLSQESQARADRSDERLQALLQSHKDEMANARNLTREERDVLTQQFDRERESAQRQSDQARQDHLNFQEILTQQLQKAREDSVRQANEADDRHALILERLMQHVESLRLPTDNALDQAANPPHPGQSGEVNAELTAQLTRLQEQLTALQGRFEESGQHNEALINLLRDSQRFANERSAGTDRRTDENNARQREEFNRRQTDLMDRHAREIQTLMEGFDRRATESEERFKALLQNHREEMARVSDMATEERRALTAQVQEARADATAARTEAANQAAQAADRQAALIRDFMQHMREMGIPVPAAPDQVVNPSNPTPAQVVNPDQPERPGDVNAGLMDRLTQLQAQLADLQRRFDQSAQMREEMARLRDELRLLREGGDVPHKPHLTLIRSTTQENPSPRSGHNPVPTPAIPPLRLDPEASTVETTEETVSPLIPSPDPVTASTSVPVELSKEQLASMQKWISGAADAVFKRDKGSRFSANGLLRSDEAQMQDGRERKVVNHLSEMLFADDAKRKELFSKRANASIIIEFARQISSDRQLLTGTGFATAIFNSNNWKKHLSDSDLKEVALSSYDFIAKSSGNFNLIKSALPVMKNSHNITLYNLVNEFDGPAGSAKKGTRTESFDHVKYNERLKDVNSSVYFNGSEKLASPTSGSASLAV